MLYDVFLFSEQFLQWFEHLVPSTCIYCSCIAALIRASAIHTATINVLFLVNVVQGSHSLEKSLNFRLSLEKSLKMIKYLEKSLNLIVTLKSL